MTLRLPWLPTFAQFLDAARREGCIERTVRGRLVLENPKLKLPVVVKPMQPNEQLTQFYAEYLCRMLGVTGFSFDHPTNPDWGPTDEEQT
jgi:hypothetical protein